MPIFLYEMFFHMYRHPYSRASDIILKTMANKNTAKNNGKEGSEKKIVGITFGAFDLLHYGHCLMLQEAKEQCDYLIVGLQIDPSKTPKEYRGKKKLPPIQTLEERKIQVECNKYVDEVRIYDSEEDLYQMLLDVKPDVRIIGADWEGKAFTGHDLPIKVHYNSRNHNHSSTELKERILNNAKLIQKARKLEKASVR